VTRVLSTGIGGRHPWAWAEQQHRDKKDARCPVKKKKAGVRATQFRPLENWDPVQGDTARVIVGFPLLLPGSDARFRKMYD
jgi:hypothetical protein